MGFSFGLLQALFCVMLSTFTSSSAFTGKQSLEQKKWIRLEKAEGDYPLEVTFAIPQTNKEWLESKLWLVSDPFSKEYGNYMNFDEIAKHVHGKEDSVKAIEDTLTSNGVDVTTIRYTIGKDFAIVKIPVHIAEKLFSADFYHFTDGTLRVVKSLDYTIPPSLIEHVDFVSGIGEFPRPNKVKVTKSDGARLGTAAIDPGFINSKYNLSDYSATNTNNSQGVASFLKEYFSASDLQDFQKAYELPVKPVTKVVGENMPNKQGVEANLDVQYISAVGRNVDTWFISTSTYSNNGQEDFLSWVTLQVNTTDSPWVHSISYEDEEGRIPQSYIDRVNTEFQKFGVSGRTVLFASGDAGVECESGGLGKKFYPNWPTSSPYVTSVGGTSGIDEAWIMGGGGFSDKQPMPYYQKEAVQKYLTSSAAPPTIYFNETGRAYPDVSAFAVDFLVYDADAKTPVYGTSCAAPTFAGVVSLLNDVRLNNNQSTLGFMNPLLYRKLKGLGFIDVTKGNNRGLSMICNDDGFNATAGWDPASGWGQPNFGLLKELVL